MPKHTINPNHQPDRCEVVINNDCKRVALCRCWRSSKFPLCDGSHREYNAQSGCAPVGPAIVELKESEEVNS